jgi:uncharacterized Zn finger protein (UPF0148 family)
MPTQVTNYQCPGCTGPLHFVGASGKLECEYCGASYDVAEIEALYAEKEEKAAAAQQAAEEKAAEQKKASADGGDWDTSGFSDDWGEEGAHMKAYSCPSCGAELICDESTAATSCPYCGNPTVVPGQFAGQLKPDFIIPFKYSKEDAVKALKEHCAGKFSCPRVSPTKTIFRKFRAFMFRSGCLTARRRAMPIIRQPAPAPTPPGIMKSRRQDILTFTAPAE